MGAAGYAGSYRITIGILAVIAVICIGDYGDPRGIALLKGYLDRTVHTIDRETFYEALSAIRRLGGEINDIQDPFHDFTNRAKKKEQ